MTKAEQIKQLTEANKELNERIVQSQRALTKSQKETKSVKNVANELSDNLAAANLEIQRLKSTLDCLKVRLLNARSENISLSQKLEGKRYIIENAKNNNKKLRERLKKELSLFSNGEIDTLIAVIELKKEIEMVIEILSKDRGNVCRSIDLETDLPIEKFSTLWTLLAYWNDTL